MNRKRSTRHFLTQYSLSQSSQFQIGILESLLHLVIHRLLLALYHDGGTAVEDPLRGSLHHQEVTVVILILVFMNRELAGRTFSALGEQFQHLKKRIAADDSCVANLVLVGGVERDLCHFFVFVPHGFD